MEHELRSLHHLKQIRAGEASRVFFIDLRRRCLRTSIWLLR
jgi:hypothetical protein